MDLKNLIDKIQTIWNLYWEVFNPGSKPGDFESYCIFGDDPAAIVFYYWVTVCGDSSHEMTEEIPLNGDLTVSRRTIIEVRQRYFNEQRELHRRELIKNLTIRLNMLEKLLSEHNVESLQLEISELKSKIRNHERNRLTDQLTTICNACDGSGGNRTGDDFGDCYNCEGTGFKFPYDCATCDNIIASGELCDACSAGNDPFDLDPDRHEYRPRTEI